MKFRNGQQEIESPLIAKNPMTPVPPRSDIVKANQGLSKLETVAQCNFCGCTQYESYKTVGEWTIVRCKACQFCFTNPRPLPQDLSKYYMEGYFRNPAIFGTYYDQQFAGAQTAVGFQQRINDLEMHVQSRGRLLEIGAATGAFLRAMKDRGWEVEGIDISSDAARVGRDINGVEIHCGTLETFQTTAKFDVICMYQTLEHVADPNFVVRQCFALLNPAGIIVIEVPNLRAFDTRISRMRLLQNYDLPRHLNHFTPQTLGHQLKETGFAIVHIDRYRPAIVLWLLALWQKLKGRRVSAPEVKLNDGSGGGGRLPLPRKVRNWKSGLLEKASYVLPGWRFTIIARKPVE